MCEFYRASASRKLLCLWKITVQLVPGKAALFIYLLLICQIDWKENSSIINMKYFNRKRPNNNNIVTTCTAYKTNIFRSNIPLVYDSVIRYL